MASKLYDMKIIFGKVCLIFFAFLPFLFLSACSSSDPNSNENSFENNIKGTWVDPMNTENVIGIFDNNQILLGEDQLYNYEILSENSILVKFRNGGTEIIEVIDLNDESLTVVHNDERFSLARLPEYINLAERVIGLYKIEATDNSTDYMLLTGEDESINKGGGNKYKIMGNNLILFFSDDSSEYFEWNILSDVSEDSITLKEPGRAEVYTLEKIKPIKQLDQKLLGLWKTSSGENSFEFLKDGRIILNKGLVRTYEIIGNPAILIKNDQYEPKEIAYIIKDINPEKLVLSTLSPVVQAEFELFIVK
jgi:hypothetical protein